MNKKYPISHIGRLRMGIDGKGIRTLILFQQCPLRCKYCLNSFTWDHSKDAKMLSVSELYQAILIDRPYLLATNGGITFGGGEPLLYSDAIKAFSEIDQDDFSICLETSLHVPKENLKQVIDIVDKYYIDIKSMDPEVYLAYTGGCIDTVMENLKYLLEKVEVEKIVVRIPTIPGFVDKSGQMRSKEKLISMGIRYFDLFDYRMK